MKKLISLILLFAFSTSISFAVITIAPTAIDTGYCQHFYSCKTTATGGATPYVYTISAGALPSGLHISRSTGLISGTLTQTNDTAISFRVTATDKNAVTGTKDYTMYIVNKALSWTDLVSIWRLQPNTFPSYPNVYDTWRLLAGAAPLTGTNGYIPLFYNGELLNSFMHQESNSIFIRDGKYISDSTFRAKMLFDSTGIVFYGKPANYATNLVGSYSPRSFVDKNYVDSLTGGIVTPKTYKALISQNTAIAENDTINMLAGQIWEITYSPANTIDDSTLATLELVSGSLKAIGSKYRSSTNKTINWLGGLRMLYDGAPYVVSTDVSGNFAPFVNTLVNPVTFEYSTTGVYKVNTVGIYSNTKKVSANCTLGSSAEQIYTVYDGDPDYLLINVYFNSVPTDDKMVYSTLLIEVYQ